MKNTAFIGGSIALFLGAVSAQDYDATICDEQRFGQFNESRVCE